MKKILSSVIISAMALASMAAGALPALATDGFTAAQVAQHHTAADCWMIISGKVYNLTSFIPAHPGGSSIIPSCGADATAIFNIIHASDGGAAASLLPLFFIGNAITALTAPTNVAGTPGQTTALLTWTASTGGASPISYSIVRDGVSVGTSAVASFTDTGLTPSTTYSYVIVARDSNTPTASTASSAAFSVTTTGVVAVPLTAPTNVNGTPTLTSVALTWNASTGGTAPITYSIMRDGASVGTTGSTSFTNTGLTASTTYNYVIKATDSATPTAHTESSAAFSVSTLVPPPIVAGLEITKTVNNHNPLPGATVQYTLTVKALGPSDSTGISVADMLPAGLTFTGFLSGDGPYDHTTGVWTIGDLPSGSSTSLQIFAQVNNSDTPGQTITNTATASESATETNPNAANASSSVTITVGSTASPLTAPSNLAGTPTQTTVALSWTASTGGTAPITYSVMRDGVSVGTTASASFTDTGLTASTTYSYVIKATDSATPTAHTESSAAVPVTTLPNAQGPDNTPPTVTITSPANNTTSPGTITVTVNAADNVGVTSVSLYADGKKVATSNTSPYSFTLDTTKIGDDDAKTITLVVKAQDAAGNVGTSGTITIKVNNDGAGDADDDNGSDNGFNNGFNNHYNNGYNNHYNNGYNNHYNNGYNNHYNNGFKK